MVQSSGLKQCKGPVEFPRQDQSGDPPPSPTPTGNEGERERERESTGMTLAGCLS